MIVFSLWYIFFILFLLERKRKNWWPKRKNLFFLKFIHIYSKFFSDDHAEVVVTIVVLMVVVVVLVVIWMVVISRYYIFFNRILFPSLFLSLIIRFDHQHHHRRFMLCVTQCKTMHINTHASVDDIVDSTKSLHRILFSDFKSVIVIIGLMSVSLFNAYNSCCWFSFFLFWKIPV